YSDASFPGAQGLLVPSTGSSIEGGWGRMGVDSATGVLHYIFFGYRVHIQRLLSGDKIRLMCKSCLGYRVHIQRLLSGDKIRLMCKSCLFPIRISLRLPVKKVFYRLCGQMKPFATTFRFVSLLNATSKTTFASTRLKFGCIR